MTIHHWNDLICLISTCLLCLHGSPIPLVPRVHYQLISDIIILSSRLPGVPQFYNSLQTRPNFLSRYIFLLPAIFWSIFDLILVIFLFPLWLVEAQSPIPPVNHLERASYADPRDPHRFAGPDRAVNGWHFLDQPKRIRTRSSLRQSWASL
jgi:hypothetical protein